MFSPLTKKILPLLSLSLVGSTSAFGAAGIFGSDIGLQLNGGTPTFFEADLLGDARHAPTVGSNVPTAPALDSAGGFADGTRSLGTFNIAAGSMLTLVGGELLTYKNNGTDVTGAFLNYRIDGGAASPFTSLSIPFNQDSVNGTAGDQRWALSNNAVNLLSGLGNGNHTLSFYTSAPTNGTDAPTQLFDSNNSNNYTATFTVVPEPGTVALLGVGAALLGGLGWRRRQVA